MMANEFYVEIAQELGQETATQLKEFFDKEHFKVSASLSEESIKEIQNQLDKLNIDVQVPEFTENFEDLFTTISAGLNLLKEDLGDVTKTVKDLNEAKAKEQRQENFKLAEKKEKGLTSKDFESLNDNLSANNTILANGVNRLILAAGAGIAVATAADDNKRLLQLSKTTGSDLEFLQRFATSVIGSEGIGTTSDAIGVIDTLNTTLKNLRTGQVSQSDLQILRNAGVNIDEDLTITNLINCLTGLADRFDNIPSFLQGPVSKIFEDMTGTSILNFRGGDRDRNIFLEAEENIKLNESLRVMNIEFKAMSNSLLHGINPALEAFADALTPIGKGVKLFGDVLHSVLSSIAFRFGSEQEQTDLAYDMIRSGKKSDIVIPTDIKNAAIQRYIEDVTNPVNANNRVRTRRLESGGDRGNAILERSGLSAMLGTNLKLDASDLSSDAKVAARQRERMITILRDVERVNKEDMASKRPQSVITTVLGGQ